jgi:hypothetical protein
MSSLQRHEISIENIDLSGYVGIDLSKLHIPHNTRVVGDWEALELGDINAYRELVISLLTLFTLFLCFLYNFRIAIHILCARRGLVSVLNFMQSSIGVISSAFGWLRILIPWIISCQLVGYTTAAGLYIGLTSIVGILFIKAYYVNHHSYKVIIIGAICIILSFSVSMGSNWTLVTFQYGRGRCAMAFDYRWIVLKFAVDATSNLLLTICYLHKIWMKDHNKRDMAAKLLFQDGLIYGLCAILTNVAANTIILCVPSLTFWQPHVYGFDCKFHIFSHYFFY